MENELNMYFKQRKETMNPLSWGHFQSVLEEDGLGLGLSPRERQIDREREKKDSREASLEWTLRPNASCPLLNSLRGIDAKVIFWLSWWQNVIIILVRGKRGRCWAYSGDLLSVELLN